MRENDARLNKRDQIVANANLYAKSWLYCFDNHDNTASIERVQRMDYLFWFIGYALIVAAGWLLKKSIGKSIDSSIESAFSKSRIKYQDSLTRASAARQLILDREMAFIEQADECLADLVPLVQDMRDSVIEQKFSENEKEYYLKYLGMVPKCKEIGLRYQPYIPDNIFESFSQLVIQMQEDAGKWTMLAKTLSDGKEPTHEQREKADELCDNSLRLIALVRARQATYLNHISSRENGS